MRSVALPLLLLCGCYPVGPAIDGGSSDCDESFGDHTRPLDEASLRDDDAERLVIITSLMEPERRTVRLLERDFYNLHDEWSWFRLLNDHVACGASTNPVDVGRTFATIADIYEWARQQDELPLDLEFVSGGRLYSPSFYTLSLRSEPRIFAPGNIVRFDDASGGAAYAWQLTFVDEPRVPEVEAMLEALSTALGPDVYWRTASPAQENIGRTLASSGSRYADRVLIGGERPPATVCACTRPKTAAPLACLLVLAALGLVSVPRRGRSA